jgi:hypothetical protein
MKLFAGLLERVMGGRREALSETETRRNLMIYAGFVKQRKRGYRGVNGMGGLTGFSICNGIQRGNDGEAPQQRA